MGKKGNWFVALKKAFSPEPKEKKDQKTSKSKKKWFKKEKHSDPSSSAVEATAAPPLPQCPTPPPPPPPPEEVKLTEAENEQSKHAYSVALATAVAAEAAVAAAQAAAEVVRLTAVTRFSGKSKEEVAAIKIQTAFRGYLARRTLRALRGLVRLKTLINGNAVKRQVATTLQCMQTLARVQSQIRSRRIRMLEENQAHQRQLQQKREKELANLRASMGEDWDDSLQSKEQIESNLLSKQVAAMRRERSLAYAFSHQEWCEKQMEFSLLRGKPKKTKAMEAGTARHEKLEEEVIKKVKIHVKSVEDIWALKLMNFIVGANQLFFEGMTRELPLIGFLEGVWTVGVIDEIRMPSTGNIRNPLLVDTKTRSQATLPSEAQKRNGRLQLMCYKYLWDNVVSDNFPSDHFFDFFRLNPEITLSKEIKEQTASSGFPAQI